MKVFRLLTLFLSFTFILFLQACGGGSQTSDTAGALTMSSPTSANNNDGTYSVSTTVTYAPPAGKSAQGVVITTTATDSFGVVISDIATLSSGSNQVVYTFKFDQHSGVSNPVSIVSNIGGMSSSVGIVIPAITPLAATPSPVSFLIGDAALGKDEVVKITGGVGTYLLTSPIIIDGVLSVSIAGSDLTVHYISPSTVASKQTIVTVRDAANFTLNIPVNYFK